MARLYRLAPLGFTIAAGAHILSPEEASAMDEADALIAAARQQALEIVEEAKIARQEECRRGYEEGLAQARIEAAERLLTESRVLDEHLRAIEQDLTRIVVASVRKLIDSFDDHAKAGSVVRAALRQMRREKRAELRVPPALFAHFHGAIGTMIREFPEMELVDVVEDPSLQGAHIIVETAIGRVDADFADKLDDLDGVIRRATGATILNAGGEPETTGVDQATDRNADQTMAPTVAESVA